MHISLALLPVSPRKQEEERWRAKHNQRFKLPAPVLGPGISGVGAFALWRGSDHLLQGLQKNLLGLAQPHFVVSLEVKVVAADLLERNHFTPTGVPSAVFTGPKPVRVGLTEADATARGVSDSGSKIRG